jgi:hypothetical protein
MKPLLRALSALSLSVSSLAAGTASPAVAEAQGKAHALPKRGDYLPADLIKAGPSVDAKAAHLRRPPTGYGWFSLSGVFVLASVANGLIVEVVAP